MVGAWLKETLGGYKDNPVTLRDFRVQFRNARTVTLLIIYTILLTLIAFASYSAATDNQGVPISQIQSTLTSTYGSILVCLYVLVCAISAFSAAFSVTAERQRKALDLVFSAPFSPRRYVLGKVLSGLRYAGILIALALPAMTTMVAAGGATVEDILLHALLLAANAFAWCAVGVAFAGNSKNFIVPLAAASGAALFWNVFGAAISSAAQYSAMSGMTMAGVPVTGDQSVDWYYSFACTGVGLGFSSPNQLVNIFGMGVPAWIPALVILALLTRFAVVSAAASLEFPPGRSSVWLRIHGIGYTALISVILALALPPLAGSFSESRTLTILISIAFLPLLLSLFYTAPFGPDKEARLPDRTAFDWKGILQGKSTSALPFTWALAAAWWLPFLLTKDYVRTPHGLMVMVHTFIFASFWLLVMRYGCYLFRTAMMGRVTIVMTVAGAVVFTVVASVAVTINSSVNDLAFTVMDLTPIRPWYGYEEFSTNMAWVHIVILALVTALGYWHMEKLNGKKTA